MRSQPRSHEYRLKYLWDINKAVSTGECLPIWLLEIQAEYIVQDGLLQQIEYFEYMWALSSYMFPCGIIPLNVIKHCRCIIEEPFYSLCTREMNWSAMWIKQFSVRIENVLVGMLLEKRKHVRGLDIRIMFSARSTISKCSFLRKFKYASNKILSSLKKKSYYLVWLWVYRAALGQG